MSYPVAQPPGVIPESSPAAPVLAQPQAQQVPAALQPRPAPPDPLEAAGWATGKAAQANCPPGLEYLSTVDQVLVHQKIELLEVFTGLETANNYTVKNSQGQKIFYAIEESGWCGRQCCGPLRSFEMKLIDGRNREAIHLRRPLACSSCCFPCCLQTLKVCSPPGNLIGSVQQQWSLLKPKFLVKNAADDVVFQIHGPLCACSMCGDVEFYVMSKDGASRIGKISKHWSGLTREAFTDADLFGIDFPKDLDVKMKAVLLGACFLIDYMYFEKSTAHPQNR